MRSGSASHPSPPGEQGLAGPGLDYESPSERLEIAREARRAWPEAAGTGRRLADIHRFIAAAPAAARGLRARNDDDRVVRGARLLVAELDDLPAELATIREALPGATDNEEEIEV